MSDFPGVPEGAFAARDSAAAPFTPVAAPPGVAPAPGVAHHTALRFWPIALGVAGLIPFMAFGIMVQSPDINTAHRGGRALIAYGAVILSFLGAVHWGFALDTERPERPGADRARLVLGVLPALIGCGAALLQGFFGFVILAAGFATVQVAEERANHLGLMPRGYIWLRRSLTALVVILLMAVITFRLLGETPTD